MEETASNKPVSLEQKTDWLLLSNALVGNLLAGTAARIFNVSLPTISHALGTDIVGIAWALLIYQLSAISLGLVFGRLGDIYGRQKVYGIGFAIFTIGSFLCGLSENILQLIAFRFVQGLGAAMTQSTSRALAAEAVPANQAGRVQGYMTAAFHSGFFLGPTVGGLIIEHLHWRGVFFFLVPIGAIGTILSLANLKKGKASPKRQEIDYVGASLLTVSATLLVLLLDHKSAVALGPGFNRSFMIACVVLFAAFLLWETRHPSPIVLLSLFKTRALTFASLSLLMVSLAHSLSMFIMPFYLQGVLHLSPSFMGILFIASPIFTVSLAPVAGHLTDRIGARIPATIGVAMAGVSMLLGLVLKTDSHWLLPMALIAFTGLSSGLFNSPNHAALLGSVPREHRGFANGVIQLMFNLGHIVGIPLTTLLMTTTFQLYTGDSGATPTPDQPLPFVAAINYTYSIALIFIGIGLITSASRGKQRPVHAAP